MDRIIDQAVFAGQGLKDQPIVVADPAAKSAEPQMAGSIRHDEDDTVVDEPIVGGEGLERLPIIATQAAKGAKP